MNIFHFEGLQINLSSIEKFSEKNMRKKKIVFIFFILSF